MTHSTGKSAKETPGADRAFEEAAWKKRAVKKRKGRRKNDLDTESSPDLLPIIDLDDVEETTENEALSKRNAEKKVFHSMAEIASCSYEARQVSVLSFL